MWMALLWENRRIIGEVAGLIALCAIGYWFFIHNPSVIDELEKDKAELSRQVEAGKSAIVLLSKIEAGKEQVNRETFKHISSIRAAIIPRRAVLITGGVPLPGVR